MSGEKMIPKINLLYVIASMSNGGAETLAIRLAEQLDKNLFNATVCSLSDEGPLREIMQEKRVPFITMAKKEGVDLALVRRLRKELTIRQINIVHTHNIAPLLYSRPAIFLNKKIKHVHTEHINMEKELSYSMKDRLYNAILYPGLNGFISIARHLTDHFCSMYDLSRVKVATIHNSVPIAPSLEATKKSLRQEFGVGEKVPIIGNISALRPQKDHVTLLRAMKIITKHYPDACLAIAGDGELKQELAIICRELDLDKNVRFLGYRADVNELLAQFDIFVLSSLYEGLPLCILEAMAAGKPVVATDADGTNEVVLHKVTGLLTPLRDPGKMAEAILALLADPVMSVLLGTAGRRRIETEYNMSTMIHRYEDFYRNLMSGTSISEIKC
jgi:glycosyltransferase involved in cell wall biosynthesis